MRLFKIPSCRLCPYFYRAALGNPRNTPVCRSTGLILAHTTRENKRAIFLQSQPTKSPKPAHLIRNRNMSVWSDLFAARVEFRRDYYHLEPYLIIGHDKIMDLMCDEKFLLYSDIYCKTILGMPYFKTDKIIGFRVVNKTEFLAAKGNSHDRT